MLKRLFSRKAVVWLLAAGTGFAAGATLADDPNWPYPFPADPNPGGGLCALQQGCLDRGGFGTCSQCCYANCNNSNNCHNACWNKYCRYTPGAPGCPVAGS